MNRRDFLKRIAAAGLVVATPGLIKPERRFWQLDNRMLVPRRALGGDAAFLQWHFDRGLAIPGDRYELQRTEAIRIPQQHVDGYMSGELIDGWLDDTYRAVIQWERPKPIDTTAWERETGGIVQIRYA